MTKTMSQRFDVILRFISICYKVCGANTVDPNYQINWMTKFVVLAIHLFFSFTIYTIYIGVAIEGDWTLILQTLCMVGSGVQGYCKLITVISKKQDIRFLISELISLYNEYEKKHERYRQCLKKSINISTKFIKAIALMYLISIMIVIMMSAVFKLFFDRIEYILQFQLPYVDPDTDWGFITLNVAHIFCLILGAFGNFASDMYLFLCGTHVNLFKDILSCKFHDLNDEIRRCELEEERIKKEVRLRKSKHSRCLEMLVDIFRWHQRYMKFISTVDKVYYWVILIQILTLAIGIACTMFCILLGRWPGGYIYIFYCFVVLYLYCGLGTLVDISNDGFTYSIYNDVIWYKLTISEQAMLRSMLMMSQNTSGLTVASVAPLSMNTGLGLTKTIYSFTMMLINFIE